LKKNKLIRVTTVPISMNILLRNQLRFMSAYFDVIGVSSYDKKHFIEIGQREGIHMVDIEMSRSFTPIKDLLALWKMYNLFYLEKPSIVHSHTPKAGFIAMLAAWLCRVPVRLHTLAGMPLMEVKGIQKYLFTFAEKLTCYFANRVYPNSLGLLNFATKLKLCNPNKLKLIGNGSSNGIDTDYFNPQIIFDKPENRKEFRSSLSILPENCAFCFVGRIVKDKGIKELIEAFINLDDQVPNSSKLVLIGPMGTGKDFVGNDLELTIKSNHNILYLGRHDDVRPFLAASDIFVLPSYREGLPNVVLQAGAMGLPCIVSDVAGSNEIIIHNQNGLIVPVKDSKALFNKMYILLINKDLRNGLAENSRSMVTSRYQQKSLWGALLQEYLTILKEKKMQTTVLS
jgi:glycosyltransferase involved in cell wall biosynthesis